MRTTTGLPALQTPGGCGALRLGFELIATVNPQARVLVGRRPGRTIRRSSARVGLQIVEYPYYDREACTHPLRRDDRGARRKRARATSSCFTAAATIRPAPTSTTSSGRRSTRIVAERGLLPFVDIAYQGFGRGLDEDARGLRGMLRLRRSHCRAELRQEFQRLSRPRRLAVREDGHRGRDRDGDGARLPARARNVVDAA